MAFRVTDADLVRACTIGNRAAASRGSSRPSSRRRSKEPLSRRVRHHATSIVSLASETVKADYIGSFNPSIFVSIMKERFFHD